eukprot:TRINITY_DN56952_c0_g1_i1.p1 TRINITY_DN56952_c0_g1~~TRINITY_DN56952_c0_g1_i1.p1  ORF type:complete len:340 (+),score=17.54 TRINITY_DN56952_c0_g1_i1:563-1582(+)
MGAAEVFVAPLSDGACGCYYSLGEVETLLALATPAILYKMSFTKVDAIFRAALCGDFLYFMQYDIPYHLVAESIPKDPTSSFLIATTRGSFARTSSPRMSTNQLRILYKNYFWVSRWVQGILVQSCVGLTVGPVLERLIELGTRHSHMSASHLCLIYSAAFFMVVFAIVVTFVLFSKFFDFKSWALLPIFYEWSVLARMKFPCLALGGSLVSWLAILALASPLHTVALGGSVVLSADAALQWSLSGCAGFVCGVWPVGTYLQHKGKIAFTMKARVCWPPTEYLYLATSPEFGVQEEVKLPKEFLKRNLDPSSIEYQEEWERVLRPSCLEDASHNLLASD